MATKVPPPLLPLIRTTNSYSRVGHHWENPKHGGETEGPPCTTEARTNCLRRQREIILVDPIVSRPALHHVDRSPLSPITPVANQHPPALWITLQKPLLGPSTMRTAGQSAAVEWGELATTSAWTLADWIHTCGVQVVIGSCRTKSRVRSDQGTWRGADLPDLDTRTSFANPRAWFAHTHPRSWITAPTAVECLPAQSDQKGWWQLLDAVCSSGALAKW